MSRSLLPLFLLCLVACGDDDHMDAGPSDSGVDVGVGLDGGMDAADVCGGCSGDSYCDSDARVCVECLSDDHCLGETCSSTGECVECVAHADCAPAEHCASNSCMEDVCVPDARTCVDPETVAECDADGATETLVDCAAGSTCMGGDCQVEPWITEYGIASEQVLAGVSVDDGFVALGRSRSLDGSEAFVAGFDFAGSERWATTVGNPEPRGALLRCAVRSDDDILVVGSVAGSPLAARLDSDGALLWTKQFTTEGAGFIACASDGAGGMLLAGSRMDPDTRVLNASVARMSGDGVIQWLREFGTDAQEAAYTVMLDSSGGVLVGGHSGPISDHSPMVARFSIEGGFEWGRIYAPVDAQVTWLLEAGEDVVAVLNGPVTRSGYLRLAPDGAVRVGVAIEPTDTGVDLRAVRAMEIGDELVVLAEREIVRMPSRPVAIRFSSADALTSTRLFAPGDVDSNTFVPTADRTYVLSTVLEGDRALRFSALSHPGLDSCSAGTDELPVRTGSIERTSTEAEFTVRPIIAADTLSFGGREVSMAERTSCP